MQVSLDGDRSRSSRMQQTCLFDKIYNGLDHKLVYPVIY